MKKTYTCIICPNGCEITAEIDGKDIKSITGNTCRQGEKYVLQELTCPKRTIATSVLVENGTDPLVSVRLTEPVPREKIFEVLEEIHKVVLQAPVTAGRVILANVCGLGSDVITTKNIPVSAPVSSL